MRQYSSDQSARDDQRCCISSDAEGRILATSFPTISHPLSIRPVPGVLYRLGERFDSENTGTAIAQVGRAVSPVPPSQKVDNARIYGWLGQPSSPLSSHVAVEGSRKSLDYRVSPGVSETRQPQQPRLPSLPKGKLFSSSDSSEILFRYEELVARLRRLERGGDPVPHSPPSARVAGNVQDYDTDGASHQEQMLSRASSRCSPTRTESNGQVATESPEPETDSEGSDPNEAWKTFLFGNEGSDEVVKAAFEEAKHEAVRTLHPSDPPQSSEVKMECDVVSNIATIGTRYTKPDPDAFESRHALSSDSLESTDAQSTGNFKSTDAPTDAWNSMETVLRPPSNEMDSEPDNSDVPFRAPSIEVNAGTSSASDVGSPPTAEETESTGPGSEEVESGTSESNTGALSMTSSMAVAPPRSDAAPSETGTVGEQQFRFAQPKLFVGSRSNLSQPVHVTGSRPGITLTRRRRGRPRKRADDGRADIRALPNYSSDPIEEFEADEEVARGGKVPRSLFPALELA
ncbi:hypothetical protein C8A05DRAFT_18135 [Staphylotrichum tortipilum]|uniref:Uncharacterized protein n=1 Tax=Staphylotrichum tortipilum TaxID=2831512 RepID=A0AAN6MG04_9PEZI|nr:hypothetical protein C8A05DRAFT_18135 [Staphylotrichum longicolle]